jgi:transposase-like protein
VEYPRAGAHYPRSTGEFLAWFRTDEDCLDYLEWLRWPGGFACPHCGHAGGWRLADGRVECGGCSRRTSVTAGTIFDKTRTPLTVWFHACWLFATAKDGISAQYLQRSLEIGSYQTAWAMLHRLRSALVRPGRDRLAGTVEVDETFIGGEEHGLRGGRQPGKKVLTGIAVEISEPKGIGRCRMAVLADASAASLRPFVAGNVEPGSRVITDGWVGYNGLASRGYDHERRNQKAAARRGEDPGDLLPAVHRVASLCKRWLLGTHQGRVAPAHLPAYLNEFTFRFNRRHSRSRGLVFYRVLELAAGHDPVRYHDIRATKKPRGKPPAQRGTGHPPSLDRTAAARPWRTAEMQLQFPLRLSGYPGVVYPDGSPRPEDHRCQIASFQGPRARNQWVLLAFGGPGRQDGQCVVALVSGHPGEMRAEQPPDLFGDRREQLRWRYPARHQRRHPAQGRLLLDQPGKPGAALGIRDRRRQKLRERGQARLGVRRQRLLRG